MKFFNIGMVLNWAKKRGPDSEIIKLAMLEYDELKQSSQQSQTDTPSPKMEEAIADIQRVQDWIIKTAKPGCTNMSNILYDIKQKLSSQ